MSFQSLSFRTNAFYKPDSPQETPDSAGTPVSADTLVFWTFQGITPRAEDGFVFEHEIGGSFSASKRVTDRIDWRSAMGVMQKIEAEIAPKTIRVNQEDADACRRLQRNDSYASAGRFDTHPLLLQEKEQARLQQIAAAMPKLARRAKPPGPA